MGATIEGTTIYESKIATIAETTFYESKMAPYVGTFLASRA